MISLLSGILFTRLTFSLVLPEFFLLLQPPLFQSRVVSAWHYAFSIKHFFQKSTLKVHILCAGSFNIEWSCLHRGSVSLARTRGGNRKLEFIKVSKVCIRFFIHQAEGEGSPRHFIQTEPSSRLLPRNLSPGGISALKPRIENTIAGTPGPWNISISLLAFCLFSAAAGCSLGPCRVNPEWKTQTKTIRVLLVVPADVRIYQVSPGEMMQLRRDWSETGRRNLDRAVLRGFRERNYRVKLLKAEGDIRREMGQILPLFRAVNKSIRLHTYGPQIFPDKIAHFDYSLGSLKGLLQKLHCDAMVFARGHGEISEKPGKTYISLALADSSGTILWYCVKGSRKDHDLRDPDTAQKLVDALLSDFPEAAP